ncbi:phosphodiester glycosidase family protein [Holdemania filiformis]|uniref:phosphodiester glycosidase family protein n=1 Tax=Holdemania filiformis TaxID=61171 RepID=UPI00349EF6C9
MTLFRTSRKTMIGVNGNNVIIAVAEAPGLTGSEMADLMLEEGAIHAIGLDGEGSTGCIYNGSSVMSSSRFITDAIIFTKKTESSGGDSETGLYIKTDVLAL